MMAHSCVEAVAHQDVHSRDALTQGHHCMCTSHLLPDVSTTLILSEFDAPQVIYV